MTALHIFNQLEYNPPQLTELRSAPHAGKLQQLKTDVTEAVSTLEGRTLLYVPSDDISDVSAVMKDKVCCP